MGQFTSSQLLVVLCVAFLSTTNSRADEISGLIIPRDDTGMYLRNPDGQFEITWTEKTNVALVANTRLFNKWNPNHLKYPIQQSKQVLHFPIPQGPITAIKTSKNGKSLADDLKGAANENWLSEFNLRLYFNQTPDNQQLGTQAHPRFIGLWDPTSKPRTISINGTSYELSLKKGGQESALLFNIVGTRDCKPFVCRATAIGDSKDGVLTADEIHLQPLGDQSTSDDPNKPRYLFIGDSISGNYDRGLRDTLGEQVNIHHPPTNCGPSSKGAKSIVDWLGAYDQRGRHWDVISFNHGHWDAGNNIGDYQHNLELIIKSLKKTGAKLVWVTTCPVPYGFEQAGGTDDLGKAPGRKWGVMEKHLNPWALEVISRHPEITICDQWQFVKDNEDNLYKQWWAGKNVHFRGELADALGEFLGQHIAERLDLKLAK